MDAERIRDRRTLIALPPPEDLARAFAESQRDMDGMVRAHRHVVFAAFLLGFGMGVLACLVAR